MPTKRIRYDQNHWQQLIDDQAKSGLSGAQFCREQDVAYASFMNWRKRLQNSSMQSGAVSENTFVELTAPIPTTDTSHTDVEPESHLCVELSLGAGIELRITRNR